MKNQTNNRATTEAKMRFIGKSLEYNAPLAEWLYLMGVKPEQFGPAFGRDEHKEIHRSVSAYTRYAHHLYSVLAALDDENVQSFIRVPEYCNDHILRGYIFRPEDGKYLNVSYNGLDGILVDNGVRLLLGGVPPVEICQELSGNWTMIDKKQRDTLMRYAADWEGHKSNGKYVRVTQNALAPERLDLLVQICVKTLARESKCEKFFRS